MADKPLLAAAGTGVIWAIRHYPMIPTGILLSGNPLGVVICPASMVLTSIIYGWPRLRTASVWPASLAHAVGNSVISSLVGSLLGSLDWALAWGGFRLAGLAVLCAWIILSSQPKPAPEAPEWGAPST